MATQKTGVSYVPLDDFNRAMQQLIAFLLGASLVFLVLYVRYTHQRFKRFQSLLLETVENSRRVHRMAELLRNQNLLRGEQITALERQVQALLANRPVEPDNGRRMVGGGQDEADGSDGPSAISLSAWDRIKDKVDSI